MAMMPPPRRRRRIRPRSMMRIKPISVVSATMVLSLILSMRAITQAPALGTHLARNCDGSACGVKLPYKDYSPGRHLTTKSVRSVLSTVDRRDLPWMRKDTLVTHIPAVIVKITLFLFQIAMLMATVGVCSGNISWWERTCEEESTRKRWQGPNMSGSKTTGMRINKCAALRTRFNWTWCSRIGN